MDRKEQSRGAPWSLTNIQVRACDAYVYQLCFWIYGAALFLTETKPLRQLLGKNQRTIIKTAPPSFPRVSTVLRYFLVCMYIHIHVNCNTIIYNYHLFFFYPFSFFFFNELTCNFRVTSYTGTYIHLYTWRFCTCYTGRVIINIFHCSRNTEYQVHP